MKNQLFIIPAETWIALDPHEVDATAQAMREFGIFRLPYERIDLWIDARVSLHSVFTKPVCDDHYLNELIRTGAFSMRKEGNETIFRCNMDHTECVLEIKNLSLDPANTYKYFRVLPGNKWFRPMVSRENEPLSESEHATFLKVIIVLLNTRNSVKITQRDKLAALNIGRNKGGHRHEYVTTITLPPERDRENAEGPGEPTGRHIAPHLRRGHRRDQRYGPALAFVRPVWIEPVFVNADKGWAAQRDRYNVSLGAPPPLQRGVTADV